MIDLAAADGQSEQISVEPEAVIEHVADKALLGTTLGVAMAAHAAAEFATQIACKAERHFVEAISRPIEILDFDTVVGMDAAAFRCLQVVVAEAIVIGDDIQPGKRSVLN